MKGYYLFACAFLMAFGGSHSAVMEGSSYNVTAYCTVVTPGTKLASIEDCSRYYVCTANGVMQTSCNTGYSFDKNTQSCRVSSVVSCFYDVENPCEGKNDGTFVPNVKVCGGWYSCKNGATATSGVCNTGQIFSVNQCVYGSCQSTGASDQNVLQSACQVVPAGQYFGSTKSCSEWQVCSDQGTLTTGDCSGDFSAYDVTRGLCNYPSAVTCFWVTGNSINPDPGTCDTAGARIADPTTCSKYYVCDGKTYVANSCQYGLYYDTKQQICQPRQVAIPSPTCNRCEYSSAGFVNTVSDTCQSYAVCKFGETVSTGTCGTDDFFNEQRQGCVPNITVNAYAEANGACNGVLTVDGGDGTGSGDGGDGGDGTGSGDGGTGTGDGGTGTGTGDGGTGTGTGDGGTGTGTGDGGTGTGTGDGGTGTGTGEAKTS